MCLQGPSGDAGEQGSSGLKGPRGPLGTAGSRGDRGEEGVPVSRKWESMLNSNFIHKTRFVPTSKNGKLPIIESVVKFWK